MYLGTAYEAFAIQLPLKASCRQAGLGSFQWPMPNPTSTATNFSLALGDAMVGWEACRFFWVVSEGMDILKNNSLSKALLVIFLVNAPVFSSRLSCTVTA